MDNGSRIMNGEGETGFFTGDFAIDSELPECYP